MSNYSLVIVSNYFNNHQKPICDELYKILGDNLLFIETAEMEEDRKTGGWIDFCYPEYVVRYSGKELSDYYQEIINQADVVMIDSAPLKYVKKRVKEGKIIFKPYERPFRTKKELYKLPYRIIKWHIQNPIKSKIFLLCASAFTAYDYSRIGLFKDKCYKWGYFPKTYIYDIDELLKQKQSGSLL